MNRKQLSCNPWVTLLVLVVLTACGSGGGGGGGDSPVADGGGGGVPPAQKAWGTAVLIETDLGTASGHQIAVDGSGNATAVWQQSDGTRENIWANRYVAGTGWGTAALIETNMGAAIYPQIAADAGGNAIAVWSQAGDAVYSIWGNRYVAGTGWGTAAPIATNDMWNTIGPQIAVDAGGNAIAVWSQSDGTRYNIWANRFSAGAWGTAQLIEPTDNVDVFGSGNPQIAFDGSGNAIAVWQRFDGTRDNIWANRFSAGAWGTAQLIETDNAGDASAPQIAVDGSGNATAVWIQSDGTRYDIWANRFSAGAWGTAQLIETDMGTAVEPQIAVDAGGNATAVWRQFDGTRENIWANRYVAGTGWGTAALIETGAGGAGSPQIAFDGSGNALAVWHQVVGNQVVGTRSSIWANRYVAGTGWGTAAPIENGSGHAGAPQIAVDGSGNATAVWCEFDGVRFNIFANRFE